MSGWGEQVRVDLEQARSSVSATIAAQSDDSLRLLVEALQVQVDIITAAMDRIYDEAYLSTGRPRGIYRGIVVGDGDPVGAGRLEVEVASVGGAAAWARCCHPLGTSSPAQPPARIGDTVWVMFEHGDFDRPVVMGLDLT